MDSHDLDFNYWNSRKIKIVEEYNNLRSLKNEHQKKVEEEKKQLEENQKKIAELEKKIKEMTDIAEETSRKSLATPNTSLCKSSTQTFLRQETKEFGLEVLSENKEIEAKEDDNLFECFFTLGQTSGSREPRTLFCYPEENEFSNGPQARVLANFAFPTEIRRSKHKLKEIEKKLKEIFDSPLKRDGKHFVFSVKSDVEKPPAKYRERANYKKDLVYCCCVFIDEIMDSVDGFYIIQPKCYCLVSYFPCFEFLFELLFFLIRQKIESDKDLLYPSSDRQSVKTDFSGFDLEDQNESVSFEDKRSCSQIHTTENVYDLQGPIQRIMNRDPPDELIAVLRHFKNKKAITKDLTFRNFESKQLMGFNFLDSLYFCPVIFSLLRYEDFWYIFCAILQESSVVFKGKNLDHISSCVLGFHGIIRPLYWSHVLTPVLPSSLLDILEAPFPLLVGLPSDSNFHFSKKHSHLIIVDLDCKNEEKMISKPLAQDNSVLLPNYHNKTLHYLYNKTKKLENQTAMITEIVTEIKSFISNHFSKLHNIKTNIQGLERVDEAIQILKDHSLEDIDFKMKFYNTQMSINYIEDFYLHKITKTCK
jgi:hypothetical protein